jgi:hypothetical protein
VYVVMTLTLVVALLGAVLEVGHRYLYMCMCVCVCVCGCVCACM